MKQNCELCGKKARMYCESDQASLCWECDAKVHSANFLVAKHSRCLLCDVCQSPTPWNASGEKFGPTISVCEGCFDTHNKRSEMDHHGPDSDDCSVNGDDHNSSDDEDEDSYEDEDEEEAERDEEEEGENQVVPWSSNYSPPATSSSIRGEESLTDRSVGGPLAAKRNWNDAFLDSEDEIGCASSSSQGRARSVTAIADEEEARISPSSFRPFRQQRVIVKEGENDSAAESKSTSIVTSLARLQKNAVMTQGDATASALGIFGLSQ